MSEKEKQKKGRVAVCWDRLLHYCKSHMWCSFALAILLSVLVILLILMGYMKTQYYHYLVKTTYTTQDALLDSVNKNLENQMENFVTIGSAISIDNDIMNVIPYLENSPDAYNNKILNDALKAKARTSTSIAGMALASADGVVYQYDKNDIKSTGSVPIWNKESQEEIQNAFQDLKERSKSALLPRYDIVTQPIVHPNMENVGLIHIAFPVKEENSYSNIRYMLVVSYYSSSLDSLLEQLNPNDEEYIQGYIEDSDSSILLHTKGIKYVNVSSRAYEDRDGIKDLAKEVGNYGWTLHVTIDEKIINDKVNELYNRVVLLYIAAIIMILLILFWTTNRILKPVNMIGHSIKRVQEGNRMEQISIEGSNEIWELGQEYNKMLRAIQRAYDEVEEQHQQAIESMKMKQQAEREALESQINAHFICNTLNAINYEAIDSGNYKVSILLKKLSNILRYTFDQKHQNVYMFQEISWIEQYLFLQKERMENVFDYEIEFDSDYDNWPCRKLMLQPFVENSIIHGFEGREQNGWIKITGQGYKEYLKIIIEDNGKGMSEERRQVIQEIIENPSLSREREVGIGISNVITRMRMYYGSQFQVIFQSEEGKGTKFIFILPTPPVLKEEV